MTCSSFQPFQTQLLKENQTEQIYNNKRFIRKSSNKEYRRQN